MTSLISAVPFLGSLLFYQVFCARRLLRALDVEVSAREHWISVAQRAARPLPHTSLTKGATPGLCEGLAQHICFEGGELVALSTRQGNPANNQQSSDIANLAWFAQEGVIYNQPGHFDYEPGAQRKLNPISVRELQPTRRNYLLNVTPFVVFSLFPENMGDTFGNFILPWVQWIASNPDLQGRPIVVALPKDLQLPPFWRLLEDIGVAVESFTNLASPPEGEQALCFEEIIGCSHPFQNYQFQNLYATDHGQAWESFRKAVVANRCPLAAPAPSAADALGQKPFVVAFAQRPSPRRIKNLDELLSMCDAEAGFGGGGLQCREIQFSNVLQDVCKIQDVDVLVGLTGAHITNALLMRPGTSAIEIRADQFYATDNRSMIKNVGSWPNVNGRHFWTTNNTLYWMYGARPNESFPFPGSRVPGRDSDVKVRWDVLLCMLKKAKRARRDAKIFTRFAMMVGAGCQSIGGVNF